MRERWLPYVAREKENKDCFGVSGISKTIPKAITLVQRMVEMEPCLNWSAISTFGKCNVGGFSMRFAKSLTVCKWQDNETSEVGLGELNYEV